MTDVLSFLESLLGSHKSAGSKNSEVLFFCPFCRHHKPKLAVNMSSGAWHCWVCNTGGRSLFSLLKKKGATPGQLRELARLLNLKWTYTPTEDEVEVVALPSEFNPLWEPSKSYEYKNALHYCTTRGIGHDDILKYQLGYCTSGEYANRIIIPSYDDTGKLNFFTGRSYYDSTMPYKNPPVSKNIVGFESLVSWEFPIVICEGPMDAIAIKRNAVPLFGKTLSALLQEKIVTYGKEVFLSLDADALDQVLRLADHFKLYDVVVHVVQLDGKDPSVMGFAKMNELIRTTEMFSFRERVKLGLH